MRKILFIIAAAIALPAVLQAQNEVAFQGGEKLTYSISHSYVKSADVIGVTFQTAGTTVDGRQALRVQATGKTLSGYRAFFDMNDMSVTHIPIVRSDGCAVCGA